MNSHEHPSALLDQTKAAARARARRPESTYRVQLHKDFTFRDALAIVPYLHDLGVTHLYTSPFLKAQPGSTHGYDVVDYSSVNPEIGSDADLDTLTQALAGHGMGLLIDVVPNHMGVGSSDNAWWNDVLENGRSSRFAPFFDIAWEASARPELAGKVLLPILGEPYGDVLESGALRLAFSEGALLVQYAGRSFPVRPSTYAVLLEYRLDECASWLGAPDDPSWIELKSILNAIHNLDHLSGLEPERLAGYQAEKETIKRRLGTLAQQNAALRALIDENLAAVNGRPRDPHSFDLMDRLLEGQHYRLAYWRVASDEINYRRFFDVTQFAALNMEREDVFEAAHRLILSWTAQRKVDGLRVDHPDGLFDPRRYFERLQEHFLLACARQEFESGGKKHDGPEGTDLESQLGRERDASEREPAAGPHDPILYVIAEKILATGEELPEAWAVHGTTGYDFLNEVSGLFVDESGREPLTRLYQGRTGDDLRFAKTAHRAKRLILETSLSSELQMLSRLLDKLAQKSRRSRDFTLSTLRLALAEVIACLPVYRTYIDRCGPSAADRRFIDAAIRRAGYRNPLLGRRVLRFIRDVLVGDSPDEGLDSDCRERRDFAGRFQQVTAPVTAKGVEDTAFYVDSRLVSLNEVGGDPARFGVQPPALHAFNQARQARWPFALSPLSTHDTKRGEDVRARINVLSELPAEWSAGVERWSILNERFRPTVGDLPAPDPNEEYLLYQTLVGSWPLSPFSAQEFQDFVGRIQAYMQKALHEAKVHSSWLNPDSEYDDAVLEFIRLVLDEGLNRAFLDDFRSFSDRVSGYGLLNSLSQTLLKLTAPGVPDTYQGSELWDFSLVDPDNRRPVDYAKTQRLLENLARGVQTAGALLQPLCQDLVANRADGRIKLYLHCRVLECRRSHPGLFTAGDYEPLSGAGPAGDCLFAFTRRFQNSRALVAIPRLWTRILPDPARDPIGRELWQDTWLLLSTAETGTTWRNICTGRIHRPEQSAQGLRFSAGELFEHFPVVFLLG
jgi:(1->4)-alpha-D-glucan 1-alpha-D-glucosylmutase